MPQRPQDIAIYQSAKFEDVAVEDFVDDGLLVGEEAVKRPDGDAGFGANALGGDLLERQTREQRAGRLENAGDGAAAAMLDLCRRLKPARERINPLTQDSAALGPGLTAGPRLSGFNLRRCTPLAKRRLCTHPGSHALG